MTQILAIDLGTTYFKASLFDATGQVVAIARRPVNADQPLLDRRELAADRFCRTIGELIGDLAAEAKGLNDVAAVTFATQTNSFLLLDGHDRPLTPIILWSDERAIETGNDLPRLLDGLALRETTGVPAINQQFMAAKLRWLEKNSPEIWSHVHRLCLISDYLTLWMTGNHVTEGGAAGLTCLLDIHRLTWWDEACERTGTPRAWLPECVRAGTDLGPIRAEVAKATGLPPGCRFIVGCLDQYAGAIGAGNIVPGGVSETTGTVLATVRCADCFDASLPSGVFQGPGFAADIVYQMVFGDCSANLLEAYRNSLPDRPSFDDLVRTAAEVTPDAEGLHVDRRAMGPSGMPLFHGRNDRHGRGHEVRAILEAVAVALAEQVDELCAGRRPVEIRSLGGAARSEFWRQVKADVLGCSVVATACPEPTSLGAAILAAAAIGLGSVQKITAQWVRLL
jgi:xylulokinase